MCRLHFQVWLQQQGADCRCESGEISWAQNGKILFRSRCRECEVFVQDHAAQINEQAFAAAAAMTAASQRATWNAGPARAAAAAVGAAPAAAAAAAVEAASQRAGRAALAAASVRSPPPPPSQKATIPPPQPDHAEMASSASGSHDAATLALVTRDGEGAHGMASAGARDVPASPVERLDGIATKVDHLIERTATKDDLLAISNSIVRETKQYVHHETSPIVTKVDGIETKVDGIETKVCHLIIEASTKGDLKAMRDSIVQETKQYVQQEISPIVSTIIDMRQRMADLEARCAGSVVGTIRPLRRSNSDGPLARACSAVGSLLPLPRRD